MFIDDKFYNEVHFQGVNRAMKLEVVSKLPSHRKHAIPLLLVHGAWHGAWCWENFIPYFADHGYEVHALSLRGHGNSEGRDGIRWYSAAREYVEDVEKVADSLGEAPVLIGHSMGGYITQKYLEKRDAPAGVLLASIPVSGILPMLVRLMRRHPWTTTKSLFLMDPWHLVNSPELVREGFFSDDFPDSELERLFPLVQPESFKLALETSFLRLPRPRRVKTPLLVLAAENDRVFSVAEERATARAYGTEAIVFPNMAHDMMLEKGWKDVADRILEWLGHRGL
jgi:pimeloyl-ACP methyl ester carboxylesterase